MRDSEIRIRMLETLFNLAENDNINDVRNLRKYVININEDIEWPVEYFAYRRAIDKITLAANFKDIYSLDDARTAVMIYKKIDSYSKLGQIKYGGTQNET